MTRNIRKWVLTPAFLIVLFAAHAAADRESATRIYFLGNSLTDGLQYDALVKLSEAGGQKIVWGRTMIPGAPIYYFWSRPGQGFSRAPFGTWDKALREQEWDVLTLQVGNNPSFAGQFQAADQFRRLAMERSPRLAVYVYATWPGRQRGAAWDRSFLEADPRVNPQAGAPFDFQSWVEKMPAELREHYRPTSSRNRAEVQVRGMRRLLPDAPPVRLIPAAHAMLLLSQKTRAGLVPGLTAVYNLYSDGLHLNNAGSYLVALTFYATIFGKNPVGLPVGGYQAQPGNPAANVQITPALARVFQETVWEVVASHPLTGVTAADPLRVATPALDPAVVDEPYAFELSPAFGRAPHRWRLAHGSLPPGLAVTPTGRIEGRPTAAGTSTVRFAVTDTAGTEATAEFSLAVEAPVDPVIPPQPLPALAVGTVILQE